MKLKILLLLLFSGVIYTSFLSVAEYVSIALKVNDIVKVVGVMNIAGAYGTLLISAYAFVRVLCILLHWRFPNFNGNYIAYTVCLVITPILTYITHVEIEANIKGYVECKDQRELWSRYSSRTYAKTEALCLTLK